MHKLWLVGGGSGQPDYLLPLAKQVLEQVDCVIASERFLKLAAGKKQIGAAANPAGNRFGCNFGFRRPFTL